MRRMMSYAGAVAGTAFLSAVSYAGVTWARYGHVDPARHPRDELLDRFLPGPEVDEYHAFDVGAPAEITLDAAKKLDLMASPFIAAIFRLRALPATLRGEPFRPVGPRGILAETLGMGWGVLADVPGREIVVGSYCQPWHEDVTFHALPPDRFASFEEPGYVKIAWTLQAIPLGLDRSRFVTRTRVVATDADARRRFRRYWAPMSSGIVLIRYLTLPMVRKDAERRARMLGDKTPATPAREVTAS